MKLREFPGCYNQECYRQRRTSMALSKENVRRYTTKRAMFLQDIIAPALKIMG